MDRLKLIANLCLGILLFICLLALGPAIALKTTVLSTPFVARTLDGLDMSALACEQAPLLGSSPYLPSNAEDTLLAHTDVLKQAVLEVAVETHRYIISGGEFDLTKAVRSGLFTPELGVSIIADLNLEPTAREIIHEIVPPVIGGYAVAPYLEAPVPAMADWLKLQLTDMLVPAYDYLFSAAPAAEIINIGLEDITEEVRLIVKESFLQAPPPEAAGIPPLILSLTFDLGWHTFSQEIPAALELDLSEILGQPGKLAKALSATEETLREVRLWAGRCQTGFIALVAITMILIMAVLLVNRLQPANFFTLGLSLSSAGIIGLIGGLLGQRGGAMGLVNSTTLPAAVESWLLGLVGDVFLPMLIFAAGCIVVGAALIGAWFVVQKRAITS